MFIPVNVSIQTGEDYTSAVNLSFIENDNSTETCTTFKPDVQGNSLHFTTLRIPFYDDLVDYINVTLIGRNLSCGFTLFVMPLTKPQTEAWTGIWLTCQLLSNTSNDKCTFNCHCPGGCSVIQVSKRPRKPEDSSWSLCYFHFLYPSAGNYICFFL